MIRRIMISVTLLIMMATSGALAQDKEAALALTLDDAVIRTLKNNFGVAIQVLNPDLAALSLSQAKEKFLPTLGFGFGKRNNESASYSWLEAAERTTTEYSDYDVQISQLIPTGGTITASLTGYRNLTNSKFQTVNPRFGNTLRLDFRQPLLKDFGLKMTRRDIIISQNSLEISENDLEATLASTVYSVEEAYWNLVYSQENLKMRQQSLQLARDLLAKNERAVEVGTMAPIDILSAQAEVASREADILSAEAEVKSNEDRLRTIINLPEAEIKLALPIKPVDSPRFEEQEIGLDEALLTAMQNRPELKSLKVELRNQDLNLSYAKNQLLPSLDLTAAYWSPGISGDQIIYSDPISGNIVDIIPGGASGAIKDALGFRYKNWSVSLTLDVPLSSIFSKAQYAQAKLNLEQAMLQLKNQEQIIFLEIRNAVRAVQTNYKRVQSYRAARELAEKKLQAEEEKLKVGLTTNFVVLTYQRDLSNAQISELSAVVDYTLSLANLEKAMGTILKNRNIAVDQIMKTE
jgi:outer membrane protein TolC